MAPVPFWNGEQHARYFSGPEDPAVRHDPVVIHDAASIARTVRRRRIVHMGLCRFGGKSHMGPVRRVFKR